MKELKVREAKALSEEDYELAEELSREMESISLEQERERTITTDSQSTVSIASSSGKARDNLVPWLSWLGGTGAVCVYGR